MATFKQQIFDITGDLSTSVSDASITQWLTSGARFILNAMPIHKLERISSIQNFTNTQDVEGKRIISVLRKDASNNNRFMPCRRLEASQIGKVHDSSYMEYASVTDPAYIVSNELVNTFPESVATNDSRVVSINTDITVAHGVEVIDNFPDEAEYAVTLYAARQALKKLIADANNDEDVEMASSYSNQYALVDAQYKEALQVLGIEEIEERKLQRDAR